MLSFEGKFFSRRPLFPDGFLGSLAGLVPPPLVDLLLRHKELALVLNPHLFDAFAGPHQVLPQFGPEDLKLSLRLSLSLLALSVLGGVFGIDVINSVEDLRVMLALLSGSGSIESCWHPLHLLL